VEACRLTFVVYISYSTHVYKLFYTTYQCCQFFFKKNK
jgi:hypothetical protein